MLDDRSAKDAERQTPNAPRVGSDRVGWAAKEFRKVYRVMCHEAALEKHGLP